MHPAPETLALFADGKLRREALAPVVAHLDACAECRAAVETANEVLGETKAPRSRWLAIAAAVLLALIAAPVIWYLARSRTPEARLAALVPKSDRIVEPRFSGGFAWAPYQGPARAGDPATDTERLKLAGAAGEILADARKSDDAQHAAGIALVLIQQPLAGVERLRAAAERTPADAKLWSDLAAAQYAAAVHFTRPSLFPEALASADRALRIDPNLSEALFNRALTLERMGLPRVAREAWERYLAVDPSSPWANEARERLARLRPTTNTQLFKNAQPRLERAEQAEVDAIVNQFREQSRKYGEGPVLKRWAEAVQRGDEAAAARQLMIARRIGDALVRASGEAMLHETVRAIDAADAHTRARIASAQLVYTRGRLAYSKFEPTQAEADFRQSAREFAAANDPMSLLAEYFAAGARLNQNDVRTAREQLRALIAQADAHPQFIALGAQLRWELVRCHIFDDDWSGALPIIEKARAAFERLGERTSLGVMDTMAADAFCFLGRFDESWAARIRALETQSAENDRGDRMLSVVGDTAAIQLRAGALESARSLFDIHEAAVRAASKPIELVDVLTRKALLNTFLNHDGAADDNVREAMDTAQSITDPAIRERAIASALLASGATKVETEPRRAIDALTAAIDKFHATNNAMFLADASLLRARARFRVRDSEAAAADLDAGIAEVERNRLQLSGSVVGTGVVYSVTSLFNDAIADRINRGDLAGAFAYAERSRFAIAPAAAQLVSVAELQRRLAGTDAAVLELVVLPTEVVAICITADDATIARSQVSRIDELSESQLYDVLIRPSEARLARVRHLIIVADPQLENVPFAGLFDTKEKRYLVEKLTIQLAPSASALTSAPSRATRSIATIEVPSTNDFAGLPAIQDELVEVANGYREHITIPPSRATLASIRDAAARVDVLHIAGHTGRQPGLGDAALMLDEVVSWSTIAASPFNRACTVVLSACETLRTPRSPQSRALSLGGGFLAAGAADVIGTLTPITDEDARTIFTAFHKHLARGEDAANALRNAQLEAIATGRKTAWRAVALLTNRIPNRRTS